jgi:hypothetical protein
MRGAEAFIADEANSRRKGLERGKTPAVSSPDLQSNAAWQRPAPPVAAL